MKMALVGDKVRWMEGWISICTSLDSSSFKARFYKDSLKLSKARDRLDHKIAKLREARALNVRNEPDFKKSSSWARSKSGHGSARTRSLTFSKSSSSLGLGNSRLVQTLEDLSHSSCDARCNSLHFLSCSE